MRGNDTGILFGERARALEARARPRPRGILGPPSELAEVIFRLDALEPDERRRLDALEVTLEAISDDPWGTLVAPPAALEAAAIEHPGLACLLATMRAALAPLPAPRLMGIVNVTPDSFSDGGEFLDPRIAVEHGLLMLEEGAQLLDVGGESTRPGAATVNEKEERARVLPVIEGLRARTDAPISIDTTKSGVAAAALDAGATIVNDVSAGRFDPDLLPLVAERGCEVVLMHMRGRPRDMQHDPRYDDVVREVCAHLRDRTAAGLKRGIAPSKIILDPGIGFGKRLEDNLDLVRALPELRSLGRPLLLGVSRKSFLGALSETDNPGDRVGDTAAAIAAGVFLGADVLRVHDVRVMAQAVAVAVALRDERRPPPPV